MKRILILLAVLPQILFLSLGTSVCVGAGGHIQIEAAASACCADSQLAGLGAELGGELAADRPGDCGSCTDVEIGVETGVSRAPQEQDLDSLGSAAALPVELTAPLGRWQPAIVAQRGAISTSQPRHLLHLRSVLLRC